MPQCSASRRVLPIFHTLLWIVWISVAVPVAFASGLGPDGDVLVSADDVAGLASIENGNFGNAVAVGDFDGDGQSDLVIGISQQQVAGQGRAGQIAVLYGFDSQGWERRTLLDQNSPGVSDQAENDDQFGVALAVGDFDADGLDDLAVSVPFEDIDGYGATGAVHVFYGEALVGLSGNREEQITIDVATGELATNTSLGEAFATGDFDADGHDDLAISAWEATIGGDYEAGSVIVVYGGPGGLSAAGAEQWTQDDLGAVNGVDSSESGDRFGRALAAGDLNGDGACDLAVGTPGEDLGSPDVGIVNVIYGSPSGLVAQGTTRHTFEAQVGGRVGSAVVAADLDGDGYDELVAGAPWADCEAIVDCGKIYVSAGSAAGVESEWVLATHSDSGWAAGEGDQFGSNLVAGDFDGDGLEDVAVSARYKDLSPTLTSAGTVVVFYGDAVKYVGPRVSSFSQNNPGIQEIAESQDQFGRVMAVGKLDGPRDDLVLGTPNESVGSTTRAGVVQVLFSGFELFSDGFESGDLAAW